MFYARVVGAGATGALTVDPLDRRISWPMATPGEVIDHWSHARADTGAGPRHGQLSLDGVGET